MAFSLTKEPIANTYDAIRRSAIGFKGQCQNFVNATNGGSVSANMLLDVLLAARHLVGILADATADEQRVSALISFAQIQAADQTVDVTGYVKANVVGLSDIIGAIIAEYPKTADGFLSDRKMDASGDVTIADIPVKAMPASLNAVIAWIALAT